VKWSLKIQHLFAKRYNFENSEKNTVNIFAELDGKIIISVPESANFSIKAHRFHTGN